MTLEWTPDLAIGNEVIDRQHQSLFAKFNDFLEGCNQGLAKEPLLELFNFLDHYVEVHFRAEEGLMRVASFPGFSEHRAEHLQFQEKLKALEEELRTTGVTPQILIRTNKALIYWLTTHISQVDPLFATFLQSQSDKIPPIDPAT